MSKKIILTFLSILGLAVAISSSAVGLNFTQHLSQAATVYGCTSGETQSNQTCVSDRYAYKTYTLDCTVGKKIDSLCGVTSAKTCADYQGATTAENGLCKLTNPEQVLVANISDIDGRYCNGSSFNLKRYNVDLTQGSTAGPIVCANTMSTVAGKENFRFVPENITSTDIIRTIEKSEFSPCPSGFSVLNEVKCSRPATPRTCDANGETFNGTACEPCPTGKICLTTSPVTKTTEVCPYGGTLVGTLPNSYCKADNQLEIVSYTDGCDNSKNYVKVGNSCAVEETRIVDTGCSYFYTSVSQNLKAIDAGNNQCSTGGSADFEESSIVLVSNLECNGPGSGWYNYNVTLDPLVCGNNYASVGKTGFRWSKQTYSKITTLQKIPTTTKVCPLGWTMIEIHCKQPPVTQEYREPTASSTSSSVNSSADSSVVISSSNSSVSTISSLVSSMSSSVSSSVFSSAQSSVSSVISSNQSTVSSMDSSSSISTNSSTSSDSSVSSVKNDSSVNSSANSVVTTDLNCSVTGIVYIDVNNNGIQDVDEPSGNIPANTKIVGYYQGSETSYINADGNKIETNGSYKFSNLDCTKTFFVHITAPEGYAVTGSKENGEGIGSNPTSINLYTASSKTFDAGKDGLIIYGITDTPTTPIESNTDTNVVKTVTITSANSQTAQSSTTSSQSSVSTQPSPGPTYTTTTVVTNRPPPTVNESQSELIRTGGSNPIMYTTLASAFGLMAIVFFNKRNRNLLNNIK